MLFALKFGVSILFISTFAVRCINTRVAVIYSSKSHVKIFGHAWQVHLSKKIKAATLKPILCHRGKRKDMKKHLLRSRYQRRTLLYVVQYLI